MEGTRQLLYKLDAKHFYGLNLYLRLPRFITITHIGCFLCGFGWEAGNVLQREIIGRRACRNEKCRTEDKEIYSNY